MEALGLPDAMCRKVDMLDRESVLAAVAEAEAAYSPAEILVNNAGIMMNGDPTTQDPSEWDKMIDVNMKGSMNAIHAVLKGMVDRESGTIVNVGSIAGRKTFGAHSVYCGTKFGLHAITETIREEVARKNVRLITMAPGMVSTELIEGSTDKDAREGWLNYAEEIGGALVPDDIAGSILWACEAPQRMCVRELVICPTHQEP